MKTNRRLIEHIENAGQARADLCRQANSLGFATAERCCRTIEAQVVKTNGKQKLESRLDFAQNLRGDFDVTGVELDLFEESEAISQT